jgi:hypothetical protein
MKNLELMGVQEMNAMQMIETDGGFIPLVVFAGVWILSNVVFAKKAY